MPKKSRGFYAIKIAIRTALHLQKNGKFLFSLFRIVLELNISKVGNRYHGNNCNK
jgi:hypothetical protein